MKPNPPVMMTFLPQKVLSRSRGIVLRPFRGGRRCPGAVTVVNSHPRYSHLVVWFTYTHFKYRRTANLGARPAAGNRNAGLPQNLQLIPDDFRVPQ